MSLLGTWTKVSEQVNNNSPTIDFYPQNSTLHIHPYEHDSNKIRIDYSSTNKGFRDLYKTQVIPLNNKFDYTWHDNLTGSFVLEPTTNILIETLTDGGNTHTSIWEKTKDSE